MLIESFAAKWNILSWVCLSYENMSFRIILFCYVQGPHIEWHKHSCLFGPEHTNARACMRTHIGFIMMTSSNGYIFRVTGPLCGEFTGPRRIPRTKASDTELWCFFHLRPNKRLSKQSWRWWPETTSYSFWRHCNVSLLLLMLLLLLEVVHAVVHVSPSAAAALAVATAVVAVAAIVAAIVAVATVAAKTVTDQQRSVEYFE